MIVLFYQKEVLVSNLRMFIGATPSQVLVLGLNRSTELRQLVPSLPPATYSMPSSTATPALLRRLNMLAMAVQVLLCWLKQFRSHAHPVTSMFMGSLDPGNTQGALMMKVTAYNLPGGHIFPRLQDARSCHNLPRHISYHLAISKQLENKY